MIWITVDVEVEKMACQPDIDLTSGEASMKNTPDALCKNLIPETCNHHPPKVATTQRRQVMESTRSDVSFDQKVGHESLDVASHNPYT